MRTITCNMCELDLPIDAFYPTRVKAGTKRGRCKRCSVQYSMTWNSSHPERVEISAARHADRNRTRQRERAKETRKQRTQYMRGWRERNRARVNELAAELRPISDTYIRIRGSRIPIWADRQAMRILYREARRLTKETGIPHEVDHVIPLNNPIVCGLHVETNLRIVPRTINRSKHNNIVEAAYF